MDHSNAIYPQQAFPVVDADQPLTDLTYIPRHPHCFMSDTDSSAFIIDTGANRVIIRREAHAKFCSS